MGIAGLGKTTVAKSVYNHIEISSHFQQKVWVCVSTTFEVENILSGILGNLKPEKSALRGKAAIIKNLQGDLEGKRYLLVLDDVWNEDLRKWDDLRTCLLSIRGTQGSNIIVTTRKAKVAQIMETLPTCDMRKLSDDECWLILKHKAVPARSMLPEDQERIGKEIAKKCGGVPLVAKVCCIYICIIHLKFSYWIWILCYNFALLEFARLCIGSCHVIRSHQIKLLLLIISTELNVTDKL